MIAAVIVLALLSLVLAVLLVAACWVVYGLLNRVLVQAKVAPLEAPKFTEDVEPVKPKREPLASFRISV